MVKNRYTLILTQLIRNFIIDGVWVKDPNNHECVTNEFGQENSLVVVPKIESGNTEARPAVVPGS